MIIKYGRGRNSYISDTIKVYEPEFFYVSGSTPIAVISTSSSIRNKITVTSNKTINLNTSISLFVDLSFIGGRYFVGGTSTHIRSRMKAMPFVPKTTYVSVEDANIYFDGKLDPQGWYDLDLNTKQKALVEASTILDLFNYVDSKKEYTQEHEFPRNVIYEHIKYDVDQIPFDIKYAVCELALALTNGFDRNQIIDSLSIKSDTFSAVKTEYDRSLISQHSAAGVPPIVWQFILPYLRDSRSVVMNRLS